MKATKEDRELAWAILTNLSDRREIPRWLGNKRDDAARMVQKDVAELIAAHRASQEKADGKEGATHR